MKLDEFDYRILEQLQKNARLSYAVIGKDIGLTAPAVAKRVKKMEQSGLITGYTLALNQALLGKTIKAFVTIKIGFAKLQAFKKNLSNFEEIQACYRVTGEDCMMMEVLLKNNAHLVDFLDQLAVFGITKTNLVLDNLVTIGK